MKTSAAPRGRTGRESPVRMFKLALPALAMLSLPLQAGLWDGADSYDGWLDVDWYGFLYPVEDYILHAEHGWQYPYGADPESVFVYDYTTGAWAWTRDTVYPWLYWYGDKEDWIFYYRGASLGSRWFYDRGRDSFLHESDLAPAVFESGAFTRHTVEASAGTSATVTDPSTGLVFTVPAGQSGELGVARLVAAPEAPYPGEGYTMEADGLTELDLVMGPDRMEAGALPLVFVHAEMQGAFDDEIGYARRWIGVAYEETEEGEFRFNLPVPQAPETLATRESGGISIRDDNPNPPLHFFVSQISSDMPEAEQRINIGLQVAAYAGNLADTLSPATRSSFETRRDRRRISIGYGANYYTGFNKLRAGSYGRAFRPYMEISSPLKTQSLAHEVGHYLTHLLVGDDAYDALEYAGGSIFSGNHGIRDTIGRNNLLEDYAYFIESFLQGTGGNYNLEYPHITFGGMTPLTRDFPGLEGFAAHMLAGLRQNKSMMPDYLGNPKEIAPLDIPYSTIFDVVAKGTRSVDTLRANCEEALDPEDKAAFQVILSRMGWSYKIKGRLVDDKGNPIEGAMVRNIAKVGEDVYEGGTTNLESDGSGEFALMGDVFGGESFLEVNLTGGTAIEVPISIDWSGKTDKRVDLGTVEVAEKTEIQVVKQLDYSNEQAFVPDFTLAHACNLTIEVLSGDASAVTAEPTTYGDYNTSRITVPITVPAGSRIHVRGTLSIVPSAESGSYGTDPNITTWALSAPNFFAYPPEPFTSTTQTHATVDATFNVTSPGIAGMFYISSGAEFRNVETDGYLGRFGGSIIVRIIGE